MMGFVANGTVGAESVPTDIFFKTGTTNTAVTERMRITSTGNVGIGTAAPLNKLHVVDSATRTNATVGTAPATMDFLSFFTPSNSQGYAHISANLHYDGTQWNLRDQGYEGWVINQSINPSNTGRWMIYHANAGANPPTLTGLMAITPSGNVGIGTTNPTGKLQVSGGDVYVDTIAKGIILKDSAGGCHRITVNSSNVLSAVTITCP